MQKWEYCCITGIREVTYEGIGTLYPHIISFDVNKPHMPIKHIEKNSTMSVVEVVAETIAKLGEEGWEMVCSGSGSNDVDFTLFFKRPKE